MALPMKLVRNAPGKCSTTDGAFDIIMDPQLRPSADGGVSWLVYRRGEEECRPGLGDQRGWPSLRDACDGVVELRKAPAAIESLPRYADSLVTLDDHIDAIIALGPTIAQAKENAEHTRAKRTLAAYAEEWAKFTAWCEAHKIQFLPATPTALALYVAHLGTWRRPRGIGVAIAAVAWHHRQARVSSPHRDVAVLDQLDGLRRRFGTRAKRKAPMTAEVTRDAVAAITDDDAAALRDRALLLVSFAGAFRRSELVAIDVPHLTWSEDGVEVMIPFSKTDQLGEGETVAIPRSDPDRPCPVRALREHLDSAGIVDGPVFRSLDPARGSRKKDRLSDHGVATIIKSRLAAAGYDPDEFSGHSPRAGMVTSAARAGRDVFEIMGTTRHRGVQKVADYVREAQKFRRSGARGLL